MWQKKYPQQPARFWMRLTSELHLSQRIHFMNNTIKFFSICQWTGISLLLGLSYACNGNGAGQQKIDTLEIASDWAFPDLLRYTFDYQGQRLQEVQEISVHNDSVQQRLVYTYDQDQIIRIDRISGSGELFLEQHYQYDNAERLILETYDYPTGFPTPYTTTINYTYVHDSLVIAQHARDGIQQATDSLLSFPAQQMLVVKAEEWSDSAHTGFYEAIYTFDTGTNLFAYLDQPIFPGLRGLMSWSRVMADARVPGIHGWIPNGNRVSLNIQFKELDGAPTYSMTEQASYSYNPDGQVSTLTRIRQGTELENMTISVFY